MTRYLVISATSLDRLQRDVSAYLAEGWQLAGPLVPCGAVVIYGDDRFTRAEEITFFQPLVYTTEPR